MKIGILTLPLRSNSGGILQNYALQTILKRMGHEVYTIDRHNDKSFIYRTSSWILRLFQHYFLGKQVNTSFYLWLSRKEFLKRNQKFVRFVNSHISKTEYISSNKKLPLIEKYGFDAVIVGSDQVWIPLYLPWTFLGFLKSDIRRVAYAASGLSDKKRLLPFLTDGREQLKKFKGVSCRESHGVEICKECFGVNAQHVLDPTLLLTKEDYIQLCVNIPKRNSFLLSYILDENEEKRCFVNKIAMARGLEVVDFYKLQDVGIEEWLSLFRDAAYVVTDSFHGTAFSINFNINFISITNKLRGNARFYSLLSMFGLLDRLVDETSLIEVFELKDIDYDKVNRIIAEEKRKSISFLTNVLS